MSSPPPKESAAATNTAGENPEQGTDASSSKPAKRKADQISGNEVGEVAPGDQPPASLWDLEVFPWLYEFLGINDKTNLLFVCRGLNKAVKSMRSLQLPCLVWEKRLSVGFRPFAGSSLDPLQAEPFAGSSLDLHQNFAFDIVGCQGDESHLHVQIKIVDRAWEFLPEHYQPEHYQLLEENPTQLLDIRIHRSRVQGKMLFHVGEYCNFGRGRHIWLEDGLLMEGSTDRITEHQKNRLRRYMKHTYDCVKYLVQSRDLSTGISYPSAERLMLTLHDKLHSYFPDDFDWEAANGGITRTVGLGNSLYRDQLAPYLEMMPQIMEEWERIIDRREAMG